MSSAVLDCVPNPLQLDRSHVLMNKFQGPKDSDADYKLVVESILSFLEDIRKGTPLEQANAWIREKHYNKDRLRIERLSGDTLPMDKCYINLSLIESPRDNDSKQRSGDHTLQSDQFSLAARLKVETPHKDSQVELSKLFEPRKKPDGQMKEPRRILIRGRAGVGKTTLCKKIVHDFVEMEMWNSLFASVLWVPLRNLKTWNGPKHGLTGMLRHIYLQQHPDDASLASALQQHVENSTSRGTLFILDGLDEISELLDKRDPSMFDFLVGLLNRMNVIIMTRPHVSIPYDFQKPDLEVETIGFRSDQVEDYLKAVSTPAVSENIQSFLQKSPLMRSLVHIPIQLDALCIVWDKTLVNNEGFKTMTQVYEAIVKRLWRKDIKRLKESQPHIEALSSSEIEDHTKQEIYMLESLAFSGIQYTAKLFESLCVLRKLVCQSMKLWDDYHFYGHRMGQQILLPEAIIFYT
ncbi:hypothetical protein COL940_013154 [Colletotrichum noveboracense]|nr:hypothetical protein COL940_013154 [Colletotrichum noveboracense]